MRLSGNAGTALVLVLLALAGGGGYLFKVSQENRRLELQQKLKQAQLKTKEAEARAKADEKSKAESEARKAEADRRRVEAEQANAETALAAKKQEQENLQTKVQADKAAIGRAEAEKAAADAAREKAEAEKTAADAAKEAAEKKFAAESLALKRAEEERKKADSELARTLAAKQITDAALAKSENERKAAEELASAERDRKLRMYRRAETSRAEMLALQRAERLLALDESGALAAAAADVAAEAVPGEGQAKTVKVVKVIWPEAKADDSAAGLKLADAARKLEEKTRIDQSRRAREYVTTFGALSERADAEGHHDDADYYRRALTALVPGYVDIYCELIDEARKAKRSAEEQRLCTSLMKLVPDWQRISVMVRLVERDEAYFSQMLAGRVEKGEYVKAFRKLYDSAMRDKGDRDDRRAKMQHICEVLATYVPDFEKSPEWK